MFTGIVEELGKVRRVEPLDEGVRLTFDAERVLEGTRLGDSISVAGVCQTVVELEPDGFSVVAIGTTLSRTTFGEFEAGRTVNLERAMALGERLGGHLVQGHVDGVGEVLVVERVGEHRLVDIRMPDVVADVTVLHGSITVDGVSMTVNALEGGEVAQIAVIPYTWEHTTLSRLEPGSKVNLEGDMLGKFVVHYLGRTGAAR